MERENEKIKFRELEKGDGARDSRFRFQYVEEWSLLVSTSIKPTGGGRDECEGCLGDVTRKQQGP